MGYIISSFILLGIIIIVYIVSIQRGIKAQQYEYRRYKLCKLCSKHYSKECKEIYVYKNNNQIKCDYYKPIISEDITPNEINYVSPINTTNVNSEIKKNEDDNKPLYIEERMRDRNVRKCPYCNSTNITYANYGGESPRYQCNNKQCKYYGHIFT